MAKILLIKKVLFFLRLNMGFLCQKVKIYIMLAGESLFKLLCSATIECVSFATSGCQRMGSCPTCTKFGQVRSFFRPFLPLLRATSSWTSHDGDQDLEPQPGPGHCTDYCNSRATVAHFTDSTCTCTVCVCVHHYLHSILCSMLCWNLYDGEFLGSYF